MKEKYYFKRLMSLECHKDNLMQIYYKYSKEELYQIILDAYNREDYIYYHILEKRFEVKEENVGVIFKLMTLVNDFSMVNLKRTIEFMLSVQEYNNSEKFVESLYKYCYYICLKRESWFETVKVVCCLHKLVNKESNIEIIGDNETAEE